MYINSAAFEEQARRRIISEIEKQTGASVELKTFKWNLWNQKFRLEELTLHGLEPPEENPLAHIDRIDIGLNLRTLVEKRLDLFELTVIRPAINVIVDRDGHTNIPAPRSQGERTPQTFQVSIENLNVVDGAAILNEQRIDLEFSLTNLQSMMSYHSAREVLETHFSYDGIFDRSPELRPSIPYTLSADMDYTRDTLVAHQIVVDAGKSQVKLQGKINNIVSKGIAGKLEYTGNVEVAMLNYFFRKEQFAGTAGVAGFLEFSPGYFFTRGNAGSDAVDFQGWHATKLAGEYSYHYPDRRLSFRNFKTTLIDGAVTGNVVLFGGSFNQLMHFGAREQFGSRNRYGSGLDLCGRGQVVLHDERVVVVAEQRDLRRAAVQANRFGRPQSRADHRKHGRRQRVQIGRIVGNGQDIELALGIIAR